MSGLYDNLNAAILQLPLCRLQEERERQAQLRGPPKIDPYNAATTIQKVQCTQHHPICHLRTLHSLNKLVVFRMKFAKLDVVHLLKSMP